MNKTLLLITVPVVLIFFACKKETKEKSEKLCPAVAASAVPQVVKDAFTVKYPATNVISWFNKDSVAFCAYFKTSANIEKLAEFANNGSFIKEEIETNQNGQHEDSTGTSGKLPGGCECEPQSSGD